MKAKVLMCLLVFLTILMSFSCKKSPEPITNPAADISGKWKWIMTYSGDYHLSDSNPKTPQNTGIQEIIEYSSGNQWRLIHNNIHIDSGTYSIGQGDYSPDPKFKYIYDSIVYYKNGIFIKNSEDFYKIYNDTLMFAAVFRGIYAKSLQMTAGAKYYIKQK
jgi:hypothetical protein